MMSSTDLPPGDHDNFAIGLAPPPWHSSPMAGDDLGSILRRIDRRLEKVGLTDKQAGLAAGMSSDTIRSARRQYDGGKQHGMARKTLIALAKPLQCNAEWLTSGAGPEEGNDNVPASAHPARGLRFHGTVAVGTWVEINGDNVATHNTEIPFDPRYPADRQFAVIVQGNSINRVAQSGDFLIVVELECLEPEDDDLVIVSRTRKVPALREVSAKRYKIAGKTFELRNDSSDPHFANAAPIVVKSGGKTDESETIEIRGVVLGVYRQIA